MSQDDLKAKMIECLEAVKEDVENWPNAPFKAQKDVAIGHLYEVMRLMSSFYENGVRS